MSVEINHFALYDGLSIAHKLDNYLDAFKLEEVHLFSYFASILFLYDGKTPDDWSYNYIIHGSYPFSDILDRTLEQNLKNGWLRVSGEYFQITSRGTDEYNKFSKLSIFEPRERYLAAACSTTIMMPYSEATRALTRDTAITNLILTDNKEYLNTDLVSAKFREISEAIGVPTGNDLLIPSIGWIQHLLSDDKGE